MTGREKLVPVQTVRMLIDYNPSTGILTWRQRTSDSFQEGEVCRHQRAAMWNRRYAGKPAISCVSKGYLVGMVDGLRTRAHRVAWAIYYGEWPNGVIDHINRNPLDNRIVNLRCVTQAENLRNQGPRKSMSGITGVFWNRKNKKWSARIGVDRQDIHLGNFDSIEAAARARAEAEKQYGFLPSHAAPFTQVPA